MSTEQPDPAELAAEVARLEAENAELHAEVDAAHPKKKGRLRTITSWVLLVLACLMAVLSVVVIYARNTVLDTNTFVATVGPLSRSPAVQAEVAHRVSTQVTQGIDVQGRIKAFLPSQLDFIAAPVATASQTAVNEATLKVVQSSQFQRLWLASIKNSHQQVVQLLTGSTEGALSSSNGEVTVNLQKVEEAVKQKLKAQGLGFVSSIPNIKTSDLVLFKSQQLLKIQRLVSLVNKISLILPVVTVLLFAAVIALNRDRRKGFVRTMTGLALSMAIVLVVFAVGRNYYLGSQLGSLTTQAEAAIIDAVLALLLDTVRIIMWLAAALAVVGVLAGNATVRAWVTGVRPHWLLAGPFHDFLARARRPLQWSILAIGLIILVTRTNPSLSAVLVTLLITLALIGLIGLLVGLGSSPGAEAEGTPPSAVDGPDGPPSLPEGGVSVGVPTSTSVPTPVR